jgi:phage FluMu protein Com
MVETAKNKTYPIPNLDFKLDLSRRGSEKLVRREIRCPKCGFYLLDVFGTEHYYTRVKCQKCKFSEVIDTALFRTVRTKSNRQQNGLEAETNEDLYSYLSKVRNGK